METFWREPIEIAAGDTLAWKRVLPGFSAADGWSLLYVLAGNNAPAFQFSSEPDTDGSTHTVNVPAAVTADWLAGDYSLSAFAVRADERHQFYLSELTVLPNAPALAGPEVQKTFAQQMVEKYEALLLKIAESNLTGSQVGESRFTYEEQKNIRAEHAYWFCVRKNELALSAARNGRPTGRTIKPVMRIKNAQPSVGMFGRGSGYLGW
jgi:hypothetical protein